MKNLLKAGLSLALVASVAITATATAQASTISDIENINSLIARTDLEYKGHEVISNSYTKEGSKIDYKYSDGYFEVDPKVYQPHMATTSTILTHASDTIVKNGDYSHGADRLVEVLTNMGYEDIYVSDSYKVKPTPTSIACVIATRRVELNNQNRRVVTIVVRSSSYEQEWASNVVLGKEGEADGFESAANTIVNNYLYQYLCKTSSLMYDLSRGKVDFWVTGYSRGGATANLASKKIIDRYGSFSRVYGYCIEAPQGGVKEAENPDKDYTSIHNIININDAVCYVAPSAFGFKRYGVDHYLIGTTTSEEADEIIYNQGINEAFGETGVYYDNMYYVEDSEEYKKQEDLMLKHLKALNSDATPYRYTNYSFNYQNLNIVEGKKTDTYKAIRDFFTNFIANNPIRKTTREQYVDSGVERAARRICQLLFSGVSTDEFIQIALSKLSITNFIETIFDFIISNPSVLVTDTGSTIKNIAEAFYELFIDRTNIRYKLNLTNDEIDELADDLVEVFLDTDLISEIMYEGTHNIPIIGTIFDWMYEDDAKESKAIREFFKNYEGGLRGAREDAKVLIKLILGKLEYTTDVNKVITFGMNAGKLFAKNHATLQTLAWLRTYDTWYEPTLQ